MNTLRNKDGDVIAEQIKRNEAEINLNFITFLLPSIHPFNYYMSIYMFNNYKLCKVKITCSFHFCGVHYSEDFSKIINNC